MRQTPFEKMKASLRAVVANDVIGFLPQKWEKVGSVVLIRLPDELTQYKEMIGRAYAEVLGCRTTLNAVGGIVGAYREPVVEVIYGPSMTETIHTENGIRFMLDPQRIMFSSGNMSERKRMGEVCKNGEVVVDLFAGIGYFSLPMAVYGLPKKVFACEINPVAYGYLCKNVVLNQVTDRVEPLLGDNKKTAPRNCADRVVLGYFERPDLFLPTALECLLNHEGMLHYHSIVARELSPQGPLKDVATAAARYGCSVEVGNVVFVKSYAPGIDHMVLDVRIRR